MSEPAAGAAPDDSDPPAQPRILCELSRFADQDTTESGVLWKLGESGRQLDANVIQLAPEDTVREHVEPTLDALVLVIDGTGTIGGNNGTQHVRTGSIVWLPRGATRAVRASEHGMRYVTVHQRRAGMTIGHRSYSADPRQ